MRTSIRGLIVALAALMALAGQGANADTAVSFATEDGATLFSLPSGASDWFFGQASDDVAVTAVHILMEGPMVPSLDDPNTTVPLQTINADAELACNDDPELQIPPTECTWSLEVPFIVAPGEWTITATAYGLTEDPEVPNTATASIGVTIL